MDRIKSWLNPQIPEPVGVVLPVAVVAERHFPVLEKYRSRPCPEREKFNEILHSAGFVAEDGILRAFYNSETNLIVELEVDGQIIDLRTARPFPQHPRWGLSKDLIGIWMIRHGLTPPKDYGWVKNDWS